MNEHAWTLTDVDQTADIRAWLVNQAEQHQLSYLLAHAYDGVIWGRIADRTLTTSGDIFEQVAVTLRWQTLQAAYLFGPDGMLHLWRNGDRFQYHILVDADRPEETFDEQYRLWGSATPQAQHHFTLMEEGEQGLYHAPPLSLPEGEQAALHIRHFIQFDDHDQAYIAFSRLVDLIPVSTEGGA